MVRLLDPNGVDGDVVTVSVEVDVVGVTLNDEPAPDGRPVTERSTAPVNPPEGVMVTVYNVELPGITLRVAGETVSVKFGPVGTPTARAALSRPPVMVFPERLPTGSVLSRIALFTCAVVRDGVFARTSAATPETCGAAIDVPLRYRYELFGDVE